MCTLRIHKWQAYTSTYIHTYAYRPIECAWNTDARTVIWYTCTHARMHACMRTYIHILTYAQMPYMQRWCKCTNLVNTTACVLEQLKQDLAQMSDQLADSRRREEHMARQLLSLDIFKLDVIARSEYMYTYFDTYMYTYFDTYMYAYIDALMHTYMRTLIHWCIHICVHWYIDAYMYAYIDALMHTCMRTLMHWCIHVCVHWYIDAYITYMRTWIHWCIHTCVHGYIDAYMHAYCDLLKSVYVR
jgi:hypothetical protein